MATPLLLTVGVLLALAPVLAQSELVIVKKGSAEYHRAGCDIVKDGVGVLAMTRAQAESRDLKAHAACDPANVQASSSPATASTSGRPDPVVFVYVDKAAKHYHREKCARLGNEQKKIALDAGARKYWPCPVCKPPIRKRPRK